MGLVWQFCQFLIKFWLVSIDFFSQIYLQKHQKAISQSQLSPESLHNNRLTFARKMSLLLLLPPSIIEPFALPICTTRQSFDLPYFHTTKEYFHFHDIAQNWNLINLPYIQISVLSRGCLFCVEFGSFFLLLHYGIYVCYWLPRTPTKRSNTLIDLIESGQRSHFHNA